jgi:RNA polymerase sigma factor (TIGR02999 family)
VTSSEADSNNITEWLLRWSEGDRDALERVLPLVYDECRRMAARSLRRERGEHTLNPTALVHEMYLRLVDQRRANWKNRAQFYGVVAQIMRRVLVDHARTRQAKKRGGGQTFVTLGGVGVAPDESRIVDVLAIDEALGRLAQLDRDQERIVELRFFAGLTVEETAHVLGCSPRTVKREWQLAKAWLFRELQRDAPRVQDQPTRRP